MSITLDAPVLSQVAQANSDLLDAAKQLRSVMEKSQDPAERLAMRAVIEKLLGVNRDINHALASALL
jgi:hypothetical protein